MQLHVSSYVGYVYLLPCHRGGRRLVSFAGPPFRPPWSLSAAHGCCWFRCYWCCHTVRTLVHCGLCHNAAAAAAARVRRRPWRRRNCSADADPAFAATWSSSFGAMLSSLQRATRKQLLSEPNPPYHGCLIMCAERGQQLTTTAQTPVCQLGKCLSQLFC